MPRPAKFSLPGAHASASPLAALRLPAVRTFFGHTTCSYSRRAEAMMPTAGWRSDSLARTFAQLRYFSQSPQFLKSTDKPPDSDSSRASAHSSSEPRPGPEPMRQSVLDRMGATRTVKIVVIVFICIYGTMETIFYGAALYRYLTKKPEPE